jgi:hypothetical protein
MSLAGIHSGAFLDSGQNRAGMTEGLVCSGTTGQDERGPLQIVNSPAKFRPALGHSRDSEMNIHHHFRSPRLGKQGMVQEILFT